MGAHALILDNGPWGSSRTRPVESIVLCVPQGVGWVGRLLNPGLRLPPPRGGPLLRGPGPASPVLPSDP